MQKPNFHDRQLVEVDDLQAIGDLSQTSIHEVVTRVLYTGFKPLSGFTVSPTAVPGGGVLVSTGFALDNGKFLTVPQEQTVNIISGVAVWGQPQASHATHPRISIVCVKHADRLTDSVATWFKDNSVPPTEFQSTVPTRVTDHFEIIAVHGAAATPPVVPATPPGYTKMAEILVPAGSTAVVAGNITNFITTYVVTLEQILADIIRIDATVALETTLDTHAALTSPHSSTAAATANRLMLRDANGRSKVGVPVDADDTARLDTVRTVPLLKQPVRVATTGNITLSGTQPIDGVAVVANDRVLVRAQTTTSQNGIYVVAAGAWTRATDANTVETLARGMSVYVLSGTTNGGKIYIQSANIVTVGTDAVTFVDYLDPHVLLMNPHGAVSTATANRLMLRDANGRSKVGVPVDADDTARLDTVRTVPLLKQPVRVATTGNITLSGTQTIDGVAVVANDRVLVRAQTTTSQNGIYVVAAGAWTRATDANTVESLSNGATVYVLSGTVNSGRTFIQTSNIVTIGVTAVTFVDSDTVLQGALTTHENLTAPHSATAAATANRLMLRDANGRAQVAAPSVGADIARLDTVTAHAALTNTAHGAVSAPTINTIMLRDANGRAQVAAPSAAADIARLDTVTAHTNLTNNPHAVTHAQVNAPHITHTHSTTIEIETPTSLPATFTRNSTARLQNGTLVNTNLPRFETGRFGQAVMIEEGTTNLVAEMMSQARSGLTSNNAAISTLTLVSDFGRSSNFSALSEQVTVGGNMGFLAAGEANLQSVTAGLIYTASCWVFTNAVGRSANLFIIYRDAVNAILVNFSGATTPLVAGAWTRITATVTAPANAVRAQLAASGSISQIGERFWYTDLQLEQRAYPTSWQIGGTSRAAETLTVPTAGVLSPTEGTVEFWWNPINQPASTIVSQATAPPIAQVGNYIQNNSWILWCGLNGVLRLLVKGGNATGWTGAWTLIPNLDWYQLNRWYHIVVRWENANTFWVFIDGVRYGPYVSSLPLTGIAGNIMSLGGRDAVSGPSNALFDDLRISNRARTDQEIADAFASNQPLPVDASTTYVMRMDGNIHRTQLAAGITSAPTPETLMARDAMGRAQVLSPAAAADIARLDTVRTVPLLKQPVRVATTGNITLSGTQTIDDIAVVANDRVLVRAQTTTSQNGIYVVAAGAWTRSTDANTVESLSNGATVYVLSGTVNSGRTFIQTSNIVTIGTDAVTFVDSGHVARTGDTMTGTLFAPDVRWGESNNRCIVISANANLNTVVVSGFYRLQSGHVNTPSGTTVDWSQMIVSRGIDTIAQIIIEHGSNRVFVRSGNPPDVGGSGSWSAWSEVALGIATAAATPDTLIRRDANGRAQVANGVAAGDIASFAQINNLRTLVRMGAM